MIAIALLIMGGHVYAQSSIGFGIWKTSSGAPPPPVSNGNPCVNIGGVAICDDTNAILSTMM